jgi:small subunit ribosomal protein S4
MSEYGTQLAEKQKARAIYGLLERQFSNYFVKAKRKKGDTGQHLLQLLERRLDNAVFRAGFAATHAQARQYVGHGMVMVNGKRVTIPSFSLKVGEVITLKPTARVKAQVQERLKGVHEAVPTWLTVDMEKVSATLARLPERDDVQQPLNMQLIVEFYSR